MPTLLLRLNAPLQSWGTSSTFNTRDTGYYPSKSGVIGMVASALGYDRNVDKKLLEELSGLKFGIRIDNRGILINDYQVTEIKEYEFGKNRSEMKNYNSNISNRRYLSDATFLVGLESEDRQLIEKLFNAVKNPKFALFLGRRSCPPSFPLVLGVKEENLYDALYNMEWLLPKKRQYEILRVKKKAYLRIITDADDSTKIVRDVPVSFSSSKREYRYRYVKEQKGKYIYSEKTSEHDFRQEHDPMQEWGVE
jgi:CRISPR system Cascade subunit CasD